MVVAISATTNFVATSDSCTAEIHVDYDSLGQLAVLTVSHSGTPNSTVQWSDGSSSEVHTVTSSGEFCVTVITETQCTVTQCVSVDLGIGEPCNTYIIEEPLSGGGYMLIAQSNDQHPNTSFQWSNGSIDPSIVVNETGEYCVNVIS